MNRSVAVVIALTNLIVAGASRAGDTASAATACEPLDVSTILRRVIARAEEVESQVDAPVYIFEKRSVYETLDSDGDVKSSKEKRYLTTLVRGMTFNRLVAVNGRALSQEESDRLSEGERKWRNRYTASSSGSGSDRVTDLVNGQLLARFDFALVGAESVGDRMTYVLAFRPKPIDLPEDRLMDRVINRLHGRIWVDAAEFEIARVDVETEGRLRLWGGLLGEIGSFQLFLERERSPFGAWFNRFAEASVRGRRLFSPFHMRLREIAGEMRIKTSPVDPAESVAALVLN